MNFLINLSDPIFLESFVGLLGMTLFVGPLGCLMMWNRVACLGDTMSHGAVLGLSVGFLLGINPMIALVIMTFFWAYFIGSVNKHHAPDTVMAFLGQASLSASILLFSVMPAGPPALLDSFVGNILTVTKTDVLVIWGTDIFIGVCLFFFWKKWVMICVNSELAQAMHIPVRRLQFLFFTVIGIYIAVSLQMMGALLIPAFLIVPATAVRPFSKSPESMAFKASVVAWISTFIGFALSVLWDVPTGPTLVCTALFIWGILLLLKMLLFYKKGI